MFAPHMSAREEFKQKKRVLVKAGTGVLTDNHGGVSLGRFGHLVEQIAVLKEQGKEVILVSSGAVAVGKRKLNGRAVKSGQNARAFAAAGQSGLMSLYDTLFRLKGIWCAQILVTNSDFRDEERRSNLRETVEELIRLGAVPVFNENDVISVREDISDTSSGRLRFWDNDSLAALVAGEANVDVVILLSDVEGLYEKPPTSGSSGKKRDVIDTYFPDAKFTIGTRSGTGRGGMQAKVEAALYAISRGAFAVVIASGYVMNTVTDIMAGERIGTLFVEHPEREPMTARHMVMNARKAAQALWVLEPKRRQALLVAIASNLLAARGQIIQANAKDIANAHKNNHINPLLATSLTTDEKRLECLAAGVKQIATGEDPVGKVLKRKQLPDGLVLEEVSAPIGLILAVLEGRPNLLPLMVAMAIRAGNGIIIQGSKEALHTLIAFHEVITDTIAQFKLDPKVVGLIHTHEQLEELMHLKEIDLVISPSSAEQPIKCGAQSNTRVPVINYCESVCHVYIDSEADLDTALRLIVDSKRSSSSSPITSNSFDTLLLHRDLLADGRAHAIFDILKRNNTPIYVGPHASTHYQNFPLSQLHHTGQQGVTIELVENLEDAVTHVNHYGSGHVDSIITKNQQTAKAFAQSVNSACVFHNVSTRLAEDDRFGTGGPVGVESLLSSKWMLISQAGSVLSSGKSSFTHRDLFPPRTSQASFEFQPKL